ncbi:MAG: DNA methyltransferase [Desulfosalsimonas sp.]|uniref:DNA methyltransferase n=1 Tax=Desulfosalsimonas sp. TaxID=3073848 RepID=UPI003970E3F5
MDQMHQKFDRYNPLGVLSEGMFPKLFSGSEVLSPQLNEVYELALAYYESRILSEEELLQNGAYFVKIGDQYTRHYHMCTGAPLLLPKHSSSRLRSFFEKNQFRTGYATHGLFPYRGKFHPQMIKALINVMGLKAGDVVLDPMMGSGTVPIEASLMSIRSVGIDASPFCRFMAKTKYDALSLPLEPLDRALEKSREIFDCFSKSVGSPVPGSKGRNSHQSKPGNGIQELKKSFQSGSEQVLSELVGNDSRKVFDFLLLAYLDSAGYSERSKRKSPFEQYNSILERYVFVVKKIQHVLAGVESILAEATILQGDARILPLDSESVDGILFSPPYSFAIDYLANDSFHLNLLGEDTNKLRETMVGLRGKTIKEKYWLYTEDMDCVFSECGRVLKPGRFCTLIIGTNDNQLSKALGIPKEEVKGLHRIMTETAQQHQFKPVRTLARQISGIANTMRNEYIVILQKN